MCCHLLSCLKKYWADYPAKKEADAKKAAEERRRTLALLATYSSEKNIDSVRDRNLAEIDKNIVEAQRRLEEARKKKQKNARRFFRLTR